MSLDDPFLVFLEALEVTCMGSVGNVVPTLPQDWRAGYPGTLGISDKEEASLPLPHPSQQCEIPLLWSSCSFTGAKPWLIEEVPWMVSRLLNKMRKAPMCLKSTLDPVGNHLTHPHLSPVGLRADTGHPQWWSFPWRHYLVSDSCPCALGQLHSLTRFSMMSRIYVPLLPDLVNENRFSLQQAFENGKERKEGRVCGVVCGCWGDGGGEFGGKEVGEQMQKGGCGVLEAHCVCTPVLGVLGHWVFLTKKEASLHLSYNWYKCPVITRWMVRAVRETEVLEYSFLDNPKL